MKFSLISSALKKTFLSGFLLFTILESISGQSQPDEKIIHVKFKEEFKPTGSISGKSARSGRAKMDDISEKHHAISIQRIFPDVRKYETAHRAYGLHLWYEVRFNKEIQVQDVVSEYKNLGYFQHVVESEEYKSISEFDFTPTSTLPSGANDLQFNSQWHFENLGQTGGKPGSDINLVKAWQIESGSPNIVVAVIDGGINVTHPDLIDALWTNSDEIPNNGMDDDKNGYVDDIHGYGFGDRTPILYPDGHATHVAGIIGAVTNNGIGVSGIAGGSGSGDGVRLMSLAGFGIYEVGGFEAAMVYAADNGAVISQNSWGGGSYAIVDAINYFIERAGYDNSNENFAKNIQTGPMAGGLVIFAAGNDNSFYPSWPANYQNVIAVASSDHNDERSYFSNYGTWVDITAPGSSVFSTYDNGYANLSGTSMACPHVSGIAALVVSHFQKQGLKPSDVWNRIRLSSQSITLENPSYTGQLGSGRVDAYASLREPDAIPPSPITDLSVTEIRSRSATISWTATGEDGNLGQAAEYEIRYSTVPITNLNFGSAQKISITPLPPRSGELVSLKLENLSPASTYYIALKSRDLFNNVSGLSNVSSFTTLKLPAMEVVTKQLSEQLFTGGISTKELIVKNLGDEDELLIRLGVPKISDAPVGLPGGTKGKLYTININKNLIEEIDLLSGVVIGIITMPEPSSKGIEGLAFDGDYLYYGRSGTIYKIDASTGIVLRKFDVFNVRYTRGLAWSGQSLFVSYELFNGTRGIYEVDSDDGSVLRSFNGYSELTFAGNRNTLFKLESNNLIEVDIVSGQHLREVAIGAGNIGLAYSTVQDLVFVSNSFSNSIKAINPNDGSVKYNIPYSFASALAGDEYKIGWLTNKEYVITIPPNQTVGVPLNFNASELPTGSWNGKVKVYPLNVNTSPQETAVSLNVTSSADIELEPKINFGKQYLGLNIDSTILIENRGFSNLTISNIQSNDARVLTSLSSATLIPGQKIPLKISVIPTDAMSINSSIKLISNDPDEALFEILVSVEVLRPPMIEIDRDSLVVVLEAGDSTQVEFDVTNSGGSMLDWKISIDASGIPNLTHSTNVALVSETEQKYSTEDFKLMAPSPEALRSLSYDHDTGLLYAMAALGNKYYQYNPETNIWTSLVSPLDVVGSHSVYHRGKIYHTGRKLNIYNITSNLWSSIPLPIEGDAQGITSDGLHIFTVINLKLFKFNTQSNTWSELIDLPTQLSNGVGGLTFVSGVIFAHHNKANGFSGDGNTSLFKYLISSNRWYQIESIPGKAAWGSAVNPATREYFVLGAPYNNPEENIQMATLNIKGTWNKLALPFSVSLNTAIAFVGKVGYSGVYFIEGQGGNKFGYYKTTPANWITISPSVGQLSEGGMQTIKVKLNTAGFANGIYHSNLKIQSTVPDIEKVIPLKVIVNSAPEVSLNKTAYHIGEVIVGRAASIPLTINNIGTEDLLISNITADNSEFSFFDIALPFTIPWGESKSLYLSLNPVTRGEKTGTYTFYTNDPENSEIQFTYSGKAVSPPIPIVNPTAISTNLLSGNKVTRSITIRNDGEAQMYYWNLEYLPENDWIKSETILFKTLSSGETQTVSVTIDAANKGTGKYEGKFVLWHFGEIIQEYPLIMNVTDASNLLTSTDNLDFGSSLINQSHDSTIQITNNGVLPLTISSIVSDNSNFKISENFPLIILPGNSMQLIVKFNPLTVGLKSGYLNITSNDPEQNTHIIPIKGIGVTPPDFVKSNNQVAASAFINESETKLLTFNNVGGSVLKWKIKEQIDFVTSSSYNKEEPLAPGEFSLKKVAPFAITALSLNPNNGKLYGQNTNRTEVYEYNIQTDSWQYFAGLPGPIIPSKSGGSVVLNSKMYCVYSEDSTSIFIYDFILREWSVRKNELGAGTSTIATDGSQIYLGGGGNFKSYNPVNGVWTALPIPLVSLDGSGGLNYIDGVIYAHDSSGRFAKYTISNQVWESLVRLPNKALLGSAIDLQRRRYYAYGNEGNSYLYEYDIDANAWSTKLITVFEIGNFGGLIYLPTSGNEGIYFTQGDKGVKFARYEPKVELPWLRTTPLSGEIPASADQSIGINFNAYKLKAGEYKGTLMVSTNDTKNLITEIPVTFNVLDPKPIIAISPSAYGTTVDRVIPHKDKIYIRNSGIRDSLVWNVESTLPNWLTLSKQSGHIGKSQSDSIEFTFHPGQITLTGVFNHELRIKSNDSSTPSSSINISLTYFNNAPTLISNLNSQTIGNEPVEISLIEKFNDPDNDPLKFTVSSSSPDIAKVTLNDSKLIINPIKSGTSKISITATDIYNLSVTTLFDVSVELITGIESVQSKVNLVAIPNPFERIVYIKYHSINSSRASLSLFDATGKVVWSRNYYEVAGENEIEIEVKDLSPGLYYLRLLQEGKKNTTIRIRKK